MRALAGLTGLVIVGMLGGCASSLSMPDLDIGLSGNSGEANETLVASAPPSVPPPLPVRNPKKPKHAKGRRRQLANGQDNTTAEGADKKRTSLLAQMNPFKAGSAVVSDTVETSLSPTAAYTLLAQRIHSCWLTPAAPKLPNHGFHAEVAPNSEHAKIIIYKKTANNKRGLQVYRIIINSGMTSSVFAENRRLDAKMDASFKRDIARWLKGDSSCKE